MEGGLAMALSLRVCIFTYFNFISPYWSMAVQMVNCIFPLGLRSSGVKSRGRADV